MRRHVVTAVVVSLTVVGLVTPGAAASAATRPRATARVGATAAPVLTVTPDTDLVDTDGIEVTGQGFPQSPVVVSQCMVDGPCDASFPQPIVGADGTFDVLMAVHVRTDVTGVPGGDCIALACEMRVFLGDGTVLARAPLAFRASQTLPPLVTVTPDTGLLHDQTVLVTGEAFPAGARVFLTECIGQQLFCAETLQDTAVDAGADGRFAAFVHVSRLLPDPPPGQRAFRDCATDLTPCTIQGVYAGTGGPITFGSTPIRFDASTPAGPGPALTWSPPRLFQAVDQPVFDLTGFTPGVRAQVRFCAADGTHDVCDPWITATPDATGAAHVTVPVHRISTAPDGATIDCVDRNPCRLETRARFAIERLREFVDFDPSSPIPGSPSLTLHDLTVTEGSDGRQTPARMRITLSEPASQPLTVGWGADVVVETQFNPPGGVVTIPAGATEASLPLRVVADRTDEPDLEYPVQIFPGAGFAVARRHATLRIRDDDAPSVDPPPVVSIGLGLGYEDTASARADIRLDRASGHRVVVHYHTVDVTAKAGSDYVAKRSRVVFEPGETRHVLRFQVLDDHVREGHEHFHVVVSKVDGGILARGNNVDLLDDD